MKKNHVTGRIQNEFFSVSGKMPNQFNEIIDAFQQSHTFIDSSTHFCSSNEVLYEVGKVLSTSTFFKCESIRQTRNGNFKTVKQGALTIKIPIASYSGNKKGFNPDIKSVDEKFIVEIEAGQAVANYRFLKDLFESFIFTSCEYLCIAVRNIYSTKDKNGNIKSSHYDYDTVCDFMNWLFKSRVSVPLKGVLVIGY